MKFEYAAVGEVMFMRADGVYVADVEVGYAAAGLPGHHDMIGHKLRVAVRFLGESDWSYARIESEAINVATLLMEDALPILSGASGEKLASLSAQEADTSST